jgi:hypothetical protein
VRQQRKRVAVEEGADVNEFCGVNHRKSKGFYLTQRQGLKVGIDILNGVVKAGSLRFIAEIVLIDSMTQKTRSGNCLYFV